LPDERDDLDLRGEPEPPQPRRGSFGRRRKLDENDRDVGAGRHKRCRRDTETAADVRDAGAGRQLHGLHDGIDEP
jgi:hypothetical protein